MVLLLEESLPFVLIPYALGLVVVAGHDFLLGQLPHRRKNFCEHGTFSSGTPFQRRRAPLTVLLLRAYAAQWLASPT
jgi:hypothetical protein